MKVELYSVPSSYRNVGKSRLFGLMTRVLTLFIKSLEMISHTKVLVVGIQRRTGDRDQRCAPIFEEPGDGQRLDD